MPTSTESNASLTWLAFAFLTVFSWGVYGIFLHSGQLGMNVPGSPPDPNARYKAFLFVGVAYFLTAVLAPLAVLKMNNATWVFPATGMWWSLLAGIVGAVGAFGVLLAFGAAPKPVTAYVPVIMAIIFAGAPIVNALVSISLHPPEGGLGAIKWPFWLGIILAATGGGLVTKYKPDAPAKKPVAAVAQAPVK
jgi:hypothetical protein